MIYDRDTQHQSSNMDGKRAGMRHSILDDVADDQDYIMDTSSVEADSARRKQMKLESFGDQSSSKDVLRSNQKVSSMKEVTNNGLSSRSSKNGGGEFSDENDGLLDQVSVQDP